MAIKSLVLGRVGKDNSLFMTLNSGTKVHHLLFDCGDSGISCLGRAILQNVEHLFISHCHMDHMAGFDSFFRFIYSRYNPVHIWGPKNTIEIIQCRLQGFQWNLVKNSPGSIIVHEIDEQYIETAQFFCKEQFKKKHIKKKDKYDHTIYLSENYQVDCQILDHNTECLAFAVTETEKSNIDIKALESIGITTGKWCQDLKNRSLSDEQEIVINEKKYILGELRKDLLRSNKGDKVSYVTDVIFNKLNQDKILKLIDHSNELIIESSYLDSEKELAAKNYHLTVCEAVSLAIQGNVNSLKLFHVSDRYTKSDLSKMLQIASENFSNVSFPEAWNIK